MKDKNIEIMENKDIVDSSNTEDYNNSKNPKKIKYIKRIILLILLLLLTQSYNKKNKEEKTTRIQVPLNIKINKKEENKKYPLTIKLDDKKKSSIIKKTLYNEKKFIKDYIPEEKTIKPLITNENVIDNKIKNKQNPEIIFPIISKDPLLKSYYPEGFENIIDVNYIETYINVYINNKNMGIISAKYDNEKLEIQEHELFKTYLNAFKYKNNVLSNIDFKNIPFFLKEEDYSLNFIRKDEILYINSYDKNIKINDYNYLYKSYENDFSILQNLYSSYYNDDNLNYNIGGNITLSKSKHNLVSNWNKNNNDFYVKNLYYNYDENEYSYRIGYQNYNSYNSLISGNRFLGISYNKTKNKIKNYNEREIIIEIQKKSKVYFYKDGELLLTKEFESGVHHIKTSLFPEGSYYIDILINDGFSELKDRKFIKNINLNNDYNIYLGKLEKYNKDILFETEEDIFIKLNKTFFYMDTYLTSEFFLTDSNYVFNTNFNYDYENFFIDSNFLIGNKNAQGLNLNLTYNNDSNFFNYNYNNLKKSENKFIYGGYKSHNLSYSYISENYGSVNFFYSYLDFNDNNFNNYGIKYQNTNKIKLNNYINYSLGLSRRNDENLLSLSLTYRYGNSINNFSSRLTSNNGYLSNVNNYNYNKTINENKHNFLASANINENENTYSVGYKVKNNNYGYFDFNYRQGTKSSYYGNFNTNLAYNKTNVGYGGDSIKRNGIIVEINSDEDSYFNLNFNNKKVRIKSNKKTFIPLDSYIEYTIYVEASNDNTNIYIDNSKTKLILLNGNVKTLKWETKQSYILISKLIYKGELIKNKSFYFNKSVHLSDDTGLINLELFKGDNELKFNDFSCIVNINETNKKEVVFKDTIKCS